MTTLHTLVSVPGEPLQTLYALHQYVAALCDRPSRDYLFAYEPTHQQIYLRSVNGSPLRGGVNPAWAPMAPIEQGATYTMQGVVYFDFSPSRSHPRLLEDPAAQEVAPRSTRSEAVRDRLNRKLSAFADLSLLEFNFMPSMPLDKPGMGKVRFTPIAVTAQGVIRDAQQAQRVEREGLGRGKAFGFGALHFISHQ